MKNLHRSMLAGAATVLLASMAFAQATDGQFKCEQAVDKAGAKFVGAKSKCIQKCLAGAWKGLTPFTDCNPPGYGGTTQFCIQDSLKGAEGKFSNAIRKACDPTFKVGTECPTCYDSGDCSPGGFANDQVQNIEGQVDSFVPGVACEQAGADPSEQKCQTGTAKALTKQVGGIVKCYDTCEKNQRKGLVAPGACDPPASDPAAAACINGVDGKTILAIQKICDNIPGAKPDCPGTDDYGGNNAASWTNLVDAAIAGNIPGIYCQ